MDDSVLDRRELTSRQRVTVLVLNSLANDLDRGPTSEQHTAALLRVIAYVIERGLTPALVALARAWIREREESG